MLKDPVNLAVVKITKILQDLIRENSDQLPNCKISRPTVQYNSAGQFRAEFGIEGKNGYYVVSISECFACPPRYLTEDDAVPEGTVIMIPIDGTEL